LHLSGTHDNVNLAYKAQQRLLDSALILDVSSEFIEVFVDNFRLPNDATVNVAQLISNPDQNWRVAWLGNVSGRKGKDRFQRFFVTITQSLT
jgi:hypothetical protein